MRLYLAAMWAGGVLRPEWVIHFTGHPTCGGILLPDRWDGPSRCRKEYPYDGKPALEAGHNCDDAARSDVNSGAVDGRTS